MQLHITEFNNLTCILIVVCILIVYVFLDAATLTEFFRVFSSVVRQMPRYN